MRALAIALLLAGCTKPQGASAITLGGPIATPLPAPTAIVDHTSERIAAAREDIQAERFEAAAKTLLAIVCGERVAQTEPELARCTPPPGADASEAWSLLGALAAGGNFAFATRQWTDAQRVVSRWATERPHEQADLAIAELAYSRAAAASRGVSPLLMQLGMVQQRRHACGRALASFTRVLDAEVKHLREEALNKAMECVVDDDWDDDGKADDVHGFARPEVRDALAPDKPWVADVYAYAIGQYIGDGVCDEARAGMAVLVQRFPTSRHVATLTQLMQGCP